MGDRRAPLLVAAYAVVSAAIVLLDPPSILAIVIVAPLVLLVPGLSLLMALNIESDSALPGRRLILSIALSLALTAVGGILVNIVAPLTKGSWLVWLVGFTCVCSAVAFCGARHARATPFPGPASWFSGRLPVADLWRWVLVGVVVLLLLAGAATLTEVTSRNAYDTPLTELSVQPAAGTSGGEVDLTVANRSNRAEGLRLRIVDGGASPTVKNLELPASRHWTAAERVGASGLRAVLWKAGRSQPIGAVTWNGAVTPRSAPPKRRAQPR